MPHTPIPVINAKKITRKTTPNPTIAASFYEKLQKGTAEGRIGSNPRQRGILKKLTTGHADTTKTHCKKAPFALHFFEAKGKKEF
jgi:hypothetical protein